jgi:transposase
MEKSNLTYSFFIGIDMSKCNFDVGILDANGIRICHKKFKNNQLGFELFLEWTVSKTLNEGLLFCMEHTGIYSRGLWFFLQDQGCSLWMESGFQIYRGMGIARGKNDKLDSFRIAEYALTRQFKAKITAKYDNELFKLHDLLTARNSLVNNLNRLEVPLKEMKEFGAKENYELLKRVYTEAIVGLKKSIIQVEKSINQLINENELWKEHVELATSIPGVGKIVCLWLLVYTRNFSEDFTARKFASLAGIAPFSSTSGTSINRGTHVHTHANKFLKAILHIAAITAVTWNPDVKAYHRKKKKEGKKGFVVLNNIKNKLVQQVFAVIRTKQKFDLNYIHPKAA